MADIGGNDCPKRNERNRRYAGNRVDHSAASGQSKTIGLVGVGRSGPTGHDYQRWFAKSCALTRKGRPRPETFHRDGRVSAPPASSWRAAGRRGRPRGSRRARLVEMYLDTAIIVKLLAREPDSEWFDTALVGHPLESSELTL